MIKKKQELKKKNGDVKNKVKLQLSEGTKGSRDTITDKKKLGICGSWGRAEVICRAVMLPGQFTLVYTSFY